jgi:RHS repeat-associated protein
MAYSYDASGRMTTEQDNGGTPTTYSYDAANQLVSDSLNTYTGGATITYDGEGNRTNSGYHVNADNELTSDGTWNYTYDADGNLIKKVNITGGTYAGWTWKYTYDNQNHMLSATEYNEDPDVYPGATEENAEDYSYDVFGNLLETDQYPGGTGPAVTTRYAYDAWDPTKAGATGTANWDIWADLNNNNSLQTRYVQGDAIDQIFARESSSGSAAWLLTDRLGSVRQVQDNATGSVLDTITYDAWGNITSESSSANGGHYKWTGRVEDSLTGLQYNRGRYYDSTTARWTTQDPLGFAAGDSNLYRYVMNEATMVEDPSGLRVGGVLPSAFPSAVLPLYTYSLVQGIQQFPFGPRFPPNLGATQLKAYTSYRPNTSGPKNGKNGGFIWGLNWYVPNNRTGGVIAQHVTVRFNVYQNGRPFADPRDTGDWDYWEFWRVSPKASHPTRSDLWYLSPYVDRITVGQANDVFALYDGTKCTYGSITFTGIAYFVASQQIPNLTGTVKSPHSIHLPSIISTDPNAPAILGGIFGNVSSVSTPLLHQIIVSWDARKGSGFVRTNVVAYTPSRGAPN